MAKIARSAIRRKKHRAEQVRDAQRRRRERLKSQNFGFLQIILPEQIRAGIEREADESQKTLQQMALILLARSLGLENGLELALGRKKSLLPSAKSNRKENSVGQIPALPENVGEATMQTSHAEESNAAPAAELNIQGTLDKEVISSSAPAAEPSPLEFPVEDTAPACEADTHESAFKPIPDADLDNDVSSIQPSVQTSSDPIEINDTSLRKTPDSQIPETKIISDKNTKKTSLASRRKKDTNQMEFF